MYWKCWESRPVQNNVWVAILMKLLIKTVHQLRYAWFCFVLFCLSVYLKCNLISNTILKEWLRLYFIQFGSCFPPLFIFPSGFIYNAHELRFQDKVKLLGVGHLMIDVTFHFGICWYHHCLLLTHTPPPPLTYWYFVWIHTGQL